MILEIVILTRDRPTHLSKAIKYIEKINFDAPIRLVISNNSSSEIVNSFGAHWEIRNRLENLTFHEHFVKVLKESSSSWLLITHDDDEVLPYFGELFNRFYTSDGIRFISGISQIINKEISPSAEIGYKTRLRKMRDKGDLVHNCEEFLLKQFKFGSLLPFSGIAFRTSILKEIKLDNFNLYDSLSDYYFTLSICEPIKNLPGEFVFNSQKPVINYSIHKDQSSLKNNLTYELPIRTLMCCIDFYSRFPKIIGRINFYKKLLVTTHMIRLSRKNDPSLYVELSNHWSKFNLGTIDFIISYFIIFKIAPSIPGLSLYSKIYSKIYWKLQKNRVNRNSSTLRP
jgi:hypothetical protein